jgi:hypothetical protein
MMATITGLTADRMLEIEAASVVDGDVVGNDLFLTRKDGTLINAGNVRGPQGVAGPRGSNVAAVTAQPVLDLGTINQIRAGRQLTVSDFTNMGLSVPVGLWNLSTLNDSSGNGRNLTNKGAVPFGVGINGLPATAAVFAGSTGQALYLPDIGAGDTTHIKTGSWGCWFRTARRATANQSLIGKWSSVAGQQGPFLMEIDINNHVTCYLNFTGSAAVSLAGASDVCDDRWHFVVCTFDGTVLRMYVDGVADGANFQSGAMFAGTGAVGIGGRASDANATSITNPNFGRIDEAFITGDVLLEEQVRNLYCASISHTLGVVPSTVGMSVRRRRRGSPFAVTDFPAQPLRLYNFTNAAITDQGSNNTPLSSPGTIIVPVGGAGGVPNGAYKFPGGTYLTATDANLPLGFSARSFGCWFKTNVTTGILTMISWGNQSSPANSDVRLQVINGTLRNLMGNDNVSAPTWVADGRWHFAVAVGDPAASDGVKHKLYCDGQLVHSGLTLGSNGIASLGATGFHIGSESNAANTFNGDLDGMFVCDYALTLEQIRKLYDVSAQQLGPNPKAAEDHIETMEAARLLGVFDSIESSDAVDLVVMA